MKYAIAEIGGKQHKIEEGKIYKFDRFNGKIDKVLAFTQDDSFQVGEPYLEKVKINTEVVEEKKDKKIQILRYRAKSRYRKSKGHRQPISYIKVLQINASQ